MNAKVIIVWIAAVVLMFALGIFGLINQGLIEQEKKELETMQNEVVKRKICKIILDKSEITYDFDLDDRIINGYTASYQATEDDPEKFMLISNIYNELLASNFNAELNGSSQDFLFKLNISSFDYDKEKILSLSPTFYLLNMAIVDNNDYQEFMRTLNSISTSFNCE